MMEWTISAFADESGETCAEQVEALVRAGLDHVDVRSIEGYNICDLPLDVAGKIHEKFEAAGIRVCMFGSPIGKIDIADDFATDLVKLDHLGRLKDVLSCNAVRLFSYYNARGATASQWRSESVERLNRLRGRAAEHGLVLYHENERGIFGDRCDEIEVLGEALRDPECFRLIFDFDNYNQSGDDVWENWRRLGDQTDAFHLKDSDAENRHVPAGQGNGRVREILADAHRRGWEGPLSVEPHLSRSQAVAATGPHGTAHESFATMSSEQSFHIAVMEAKSLVAQVRGEV